MMTSWVTGLVVCCVISGVLVHGAPATSGRRSSRDLDQIDGLRARLLRLQEQINALGAKQDETEKRADGGRETGSNAAVDDVNAEDDISKLQEATEAGMTSERQRLTQKLASKLDGGSDLRNLAETLSQMLKESTDRDADPEAVNSYGEYLGDAESAGGMKVDLSKEEERRGQAGEDKLDVEIDDKRLRDFYNILMTMYSEQMEEQHRSQQGVFMPDSSSRSAASGSGHSVPLVHVDEGSFGAFVDGAEKRSSQASSTAQKRPIAPAHTLRDVVRSAVERKLLRDLDEASEAGISVDDLIRDLTRQGGLRGSSS